MSIAEPLPPKLRTVMNIAKPDRSSQSKSTLPARPDEHSVKGPGRSRASIRTPLADGYHSVDRGSQDPASRPSEWERSDCSRSYPRIAGAVA